VLGVRSIPCQELALYNLENHGPTAVLQNSLVAPASTTPQLDDADGPAGRQLTSHYRKLVPRQPDLVAFSSRVTPIEEDQQAADFPVVPGAAQERAQDLQSAAIPWVFRLDQSPLSVASWFGVGRPCRRETRQLTRAQVESVAAAALTSAGLFGC